MTTMVRIAVAGAVTACLSVSSEAALSVQVDLRSGWKFTREDAAGVPVLQIEEMGDVLEGKKLVPDYPYAKPDLDDSAWRDVCVPHDFGIDEPFDIENAYYDAYLKGVGIAWYRFAFTPDGLGLKVPSDGRLFFESDGIMSHSFVFLNGHLVGGWPYGYTPVRCDLTPHLNRNGRNVLAVRVHNFADSTRFYTGAGLYRHCRLVAEDADHIVPGSVYITTPAVTTRRARVRVRYEMSVSGKKEFSFDVANPRLWDIDDPYLYTVEIEGRPYRYGIRTIGFFPDERGFQLNGRRVQLKGVCLHHELGVFGAAYNHAAMRRRLLKLKEAGFNALRSSHNQSDPDVLDLCDELGILFKDECFDQWTLPRHSNDYSRLFDRWAERDLRTWIRSDRNHPCVIIWSLGNEIEEGNRKEYGMRYIENARRLNVWAHEEDPTRPTCCANCSLCVDDTDFARVCDIFGYNYQPDRYRWFRDHHPEIPYFGSEVVCALSTRGEYIFPVPLEMTNAPRWKAYGVARQDFHSTGYALQGYWLPDVEWRAEDSEPSMMGSFLWSGFDYFGGPGDSMELRKHPNFKDPERQRRAMDEVARYGYCKSGINTCMTGLFDIAGFPKDIFYMFQARWRPDLPMCHLLPHWNWPEREGLVTPIMVFTSGDEVELFVNGEPKGRQKRGMFQYRFVWPDVVYHAGEVKAVAYRQGKIWACDSVRTTGNVAMLKAEPEQPTVGNDGEDAAYVTVSVRDSDGSIVPRTRTRVRLTLEGPGEIVGSQNGDETDFEDFRARDRHVFNGLLSVVVRANPGSCGDIVLKADSPGLETAVATIRIEERIPRIRRGISAAKPTTGESGLFRGGRCGAKGDLRTQAAKGTGAAK